MEFVIVVYPQERSVFVNGDRAGITNNVLQVNAGMHTFDLGEPRDYTPHQHDVDVRNTSPIKPMEVAFEVL